MTDASAHDLWLFAYGSLMWRPGFAYLEARRARVTGYRRCFCIYSVHHRGTPERLGMVLGLDRGGVCEGIAYRVAGGAAAETVAYLRARELINGVYREAHVPVELEGAAGGAGAAAAGEMLALTFIAERAHPNHAHRLPPAIQARLIRGGRGVSGANLDYLVSTVRHLNELGIRERELERLVTMAGGLAWRRAGGAAVSPYAAALVRAERSRPAPVRRLARKEERRRFLYRLKLGG
jgi:glutathione-specific gamma-glutamylcyclotransferase